MAARIFLTLTQRYIGVSNKGASSIDITHKSPRSRSSPTKTSAL
ncbi:hypothetical protein EMIT0P12_20908 [Pseudomonas sp. IT-P12]